MSLPQVKDNKFIELANDFKNENPNGDMNEFLVSLSHGKKLSSLKRKDAEKGFRYVTIQKLNEKPENEWRNRNDYVYPKAESPVVTDEDSNSLKRNLSEIIEHDDPIPQTKKRKINDAENKKSGDFREYLNHFLCGNSYNPNDSLFPFPEKITEFMEDCLETVEETGRHRILISGNRNCGKTKFIRHIANKLNYKYIHFGISAVPQFYSYKFWKAVEHYLEENDRVLIHCRMSRRSSKMIQHFELDRPEECVGKVVVVLECVDSSDLNSECDVSLSFPFIEKIDRQKMFEFFLKEFTLNEDITFEMMAKWTPGFELGDISDITKDIKKQCNSTHELSLQIADSVIKQHKAAQRLINRCVECPNVSWDDIGGHGDVIKELKAIVHELSNTSESSKRDGILLHGPPGCGKTMIAKALSSEMEFNFISVCCSDILDKYQGESEKNVRQIFNMARSSEPCIVFIDEIDALCSQRDNGESGGSKNTIVNTFLTQLDGMTSGNNKRILFLGATNFLERLDKAITRSGRLGKSIEITLPKSDSQRVQVLMAASKNGTEPKFLSDENGSAEEIFKIISQEKFTKKWSHADLAELIKRSKTICNKARHTFITISHVMSACQSINNERKNKTNMKEITSEKFVKYTNVKMLQEVFILKPSLPFGDKIMNIINNRINYLCKLPPCITRLIIGGQPKSGKSTLIELVAQTRNMNLVTFDGDYFKKFNKEAFLNEMINFQEIYGETIFHYVVEYIPEGVSDDILSLSERENIKNHIILIEEVSKCKGISIPAISPDEKIRLIRTVVERSGSSLELLNIESALELTDNWTYAHFVRLREGLKAYYIDFQNDITNTTFAKIVNDVID